MSACAEKLCAWVSTNFDVAHAATVFPLVDGGELVVVTGLDGVVATGVGEGATVAEGIITVVEVSSDAGGGWAVGCWEPPHAAIDNDAADTQQQSSFRCQPVILIAKTPLNA